MPCCDLSFADACLSAWNPSPFPVGYLASADLSLEPRLKHSLSGIFQTHVAAQCMNEQVNEQINE